MSSYIGRSPDTGYLDYQSITGFNGVTTTFSLNYGVPASTSLMVVLGGVVQEPTVAYAVSIDGMSIIFSTAPSTGTPCYIVYMAKQILLNRTPNMNVAVYSFTGSAYTTLNLAEVPVSQTSIQLFIDGIYQTLNTNYTLSGSVITLTSAMTSTMVADVVFLTQERISMDTVSDRTLTRLKYAIGSLVAADVVTTPAGNLSSTTVQASLAELDAEKVQKTSDTGAAVMPTGTTGQRDGSPGVGWTRFNTTLGKTESWNGSAWVAGGGATGGGGDDVFYENAQIVNTNYTITSGKNAGTFGPITIANGVSVTVPDNSVWSIV